MYNIEHFVEHLMTGEKFTIVVRHNNVKRNVYFTMDSPYNLLMTSMHNEKLLREIKRVAKIKLDIDIRLRYRNNKESTDVILGYQFSPPDTPTKTNGNAKFDKLVMAAMLGFTSSVLHPRLIGK